MVIKFICISDNIKTPKLRYTTHGIFVLIAFIFKYSGWGDFTFNCKRIMNAKISVYVTFCICTVSH